MAMENKRITQFSTERLNLTSGDYVLVDDEDNGSAKYRLDRLKETDSTLSVSGKAADAAATGQAISDEAEARAGAVTAEAEARTAAVAAEAQARQQAIIAESQARSAADTTLGNDVQDLKSAFDEITELTAIEKNIQYGYITDTKITYWEAGAYTLAYIPCEENTLYHISKTMQTTEFKIAYIKTDPAVNVPVYNFVSLSGTILETDYKTDDDAEYIIVQTYTSGGSESISFYAYDAKGISKINSDISEISADLTAYKLNIKRITDDTVKVVTEKITEDIAPDLTFTSGYIAPGGSIGSASTLKYTNKIAVSPGDVLKVTVTGSEFRFVCAYNDNTPVSASGDANVATYTVPQGINYVRLTTYTQYDGEPIYHTTTETKYKNIIEPIPMGYMTNVRSMAAGDKLYLPTHNVKNRNRYVFNANITSFSAIKFAKDDSLIVDDTNITVTNSSGTTTIPHGLTISHDITLIVENEESYTASLIRVVSAGNVFSYTTPIRFLMDENAPYIESQGSTLTECRFSWVSENINQPIWLFGDSYFSWYDVRWTYYAAEDGYLESSLLNGYAGQAAASAMTALKNLLQITTPKMVVWCLGMNNGDDSAVNASWYANYQKLIELSETYGFEIVLYTTPTTPTIDNNYKNAIVRESGYRYIEADKAVRIDAEGHWVTGALEVDNVHPTEIGAKILYYRFLADLPELMSRK